MLLNYVYNSTSLMKTKVTNKSTILQPCAKIHLNAGGVCIILLMR